MIRLGFSVALICAFVVCGAQSPPPPPTLPSPAAKGSVITVECASLPNSDPRRGDSLSEKDCRAKLLKACPGGYYVHETVGTAGSMGTMSAAFKITCH